jgi:hypothetical protein
LRSIWILFLLNFQKQKIKIFFLSLVGKDYEFVCEEKAGTTKNLIDTNKFVDSKDYHGAIGGWEITS